MGSLFKRIITKQEVAKVVEKILKQENLTANFLDPKWKILNENEKTNIVDVRFDKKTDNEIYFLTFYFSKDDSEKIQKSSFRLFETKIGEKLEKIRTCDLSDFKEIKKDLDNESDSQIDNELEQYES